MSTDPVEPPQPVEIGAYDAAGNLIARTTVGADGVLAEPLHVPAGGMVYATGWPVAIPLGSGSTVTRTVPAAPLRPEVGQPVNEPVAVEPGEAERLLTALTDDCHGSCAHEGVGGECLCASVFFPAIAALRSAPPPDRRDSAPVNPGAQAVLWYRVDGGLEVELADDEADAADRVAAMHLYCEGRIIPVGIQFLDGRTVLAKDWPAFDTALTRMELERQEAREQVRMAPVRTPLLIAECPFRSPGDEEASEIGIYDAEVAAWFQRAARPSTPTPEVG